MAQNKLKIILCHTVIICLVFRTVIATNETINKSDAFRTSRTTDQNTSVFDDQHISNMSDCRNALKIVKIIYQYYYPTALVIVSLVFGILLQVQKLGSVLKRPFAPIISIFCNYIFSPLVSALKFLK